MNSEKSEEDQDVPTGWELCTSKKNPNRKYFFNRKTGKSSWTRPQNEKSPVDNKCIKGKEEENNTTTMSREDNKKNLKRKSDGDMQNSSNKKTKEEKHTAKPINTPSPAKKRTSSSTIKDVPKRLYSVEKTHQTKPSPLRESPLPSPSPSKSANTSQGSSEGSKTKRKKNYKKNIATARLSQLRAELTADAQDDEDQETSKTSTSQSENKAQKNECNASINESQTSIHSPNENQSALPPSQFFAANKIIYSMKAQLPDRDTLKQKDTFADIEEGINNQTTEYPFMKHPVTPPQFSEASKLMSAIKSKLSYKSVKEPVETPNVFKSAGSSMNNSAELHKGIYNIFKSTKTTLRPAESSVHTFKTAKDRMESLKMRLSSEAMDTQVESMTERSSTEEMDVDSRELNAQKPASVTDSKKWPVVKSGTATVSTKENVVLVVDTNIFIHELDFIKNIMNSHIEGYKEQPTLLVPWRVVNELDALKDSNNGKGAICKRARPAMDYLYKALPDTNRIKVQPLRDANSHIYPCESPDDEILNCCLQQAERGKSVILLSNDKNLCSKAVANGVETKQLRALVLRPHTHPTAAPLSAARLQKHIYTLLSNILENEMRAKYENLWLHVLFKAPPWTLGDVLQCLLKHWVAVFNEVFPRIEYLIMDLRNTNSRIEAKGPNNLTLSDVSNFKDLCLEVAKRCQIIPEYMELAKKTVENLQTDRASESEDETTETAAIEAFEKIWTVYSSYSAKLCSALGVEHSLEDKMPGAESLQMLTSKLTIFGNQISTLSTTMEGVLNVSSSSPEFRDRVARLEGALAQSGRELGTSASAAALQHFCTKCRSMLQEAQGKFAELAHLLAVCKSTLES